MAQDQQDDMDEAGNNLLNAAEQGDIQGVIDALNSGADVNFSGDNGVTPLIKALKGGNSNIAKLLIQKGADVNKRTVFGTTPLMVAAQSGNLAIAKLLVQRGADLTLQNSDGKTALEIADENYHDDVKQFLQKSSNMGLGYVSSLSYMDSVSNPAAQYCIQNGGAVMYEKHPDGTGYGVCVFPGRKQCEVWAMYSGICQGGGQYVDADAGPEEKYCVISGGTYNPSTGSCILSTGKICNAHDYYLGNCK